MGPAQILASFAVGTVQTRLQNIFLIFRPPKPAKYAYDAAISLIMRSRSVSAELAVSLASRCLEQNDDGTFRYGHSWLRLFSFYG